MIRQKRKLFKIVSRDRFTVKKAGPRKGKQKAP